MRSNEERDRLIDVVGRLVDEVIVAGAVKSTRFLSASEAVTATKIDKNTVVLNIHPPTGKERSRLNEEYREDRMRHMTKDEQARLVWMPEFAPPPADWQHPNA